MNAMILEDFYHLRFVDCGLSQQEAADWLGVNVKTLQRWESGKTSPPKSAILALTLRAGDLGCMSDRFKGFRIDTRFGVLVYPNGGYIDPRDLYGMTFHLQLLGELKRKVKRLENAHAETKKDPVKPGLPSNVIKLKF